VLGHASDPEETSDRIVTKRLESGETAAFVRLRLENRGRSTARNIDVRVLKVHRWANIGVRVLKVHRWERHYGAAQDVGPMLESRIKALGRLVEGGVTPGLAGRCVIGFLVDKTLPRRDRSALQAA
jgi:hypothetical protein